MGIRYTVHVYKIMFNVLCVYDDCITGLSVYLAGSFWYISKVQTLFQSRKSRLHFKISFSEMLDLVFYGNKT